MAEEKKTKKPASFQEVLSAVVADKGGSEAEYLDLLNQFKFHESAGTMDPTIKQRGGGPGRGLYQFEGRGGSNRILDSAKRTRNYLKQKDLEVPKFITNIISNGTGDASKLAAEEQDMLALGDLRMKKGLDLKDYINGDIAAEDIWADHWWIGNKATRDEQRPKKINSFRNSVGALKKKEDEFTDVQESSINPEMILNNPDLDDGTKEELLKINEAEGLNPSTIEKLTTNTSLIEPNLLNDQIVNDELKMQNDRKHLGHTGNISAFPADFKLLNKSLEDGGLINTFNVGGSHEENPRGGIPVSTNPEGGQNLVEEGETMFNDYIFSDSLKLTKDIAEQFNINDKFVGKTLADISKRYNAEIEDRPFDKITVGTAKKELNKLTLANESLKPSEPSSTIFNHGGRHTTALDTQGLQQGIQLTESIAPEAGDLLTKTPAADITGGGGPGAGAYIGAATGALNIGNQIFGKATADTSGTMHQERQSEGGAALGGAMKGIQGGAAFGAPGMIIGGAAGAIGGLIGASKNNKVINEANNNFTLGESAKRRESDFKSGGLMKKKNKLYTDGGKLKKKDKQSINQSTGVDFTQEGVNSLFEKVDPNAPPTNPDLQLGKYKGLNYFDTRFDNGVASLSPTNRNPANPDLYKQQLRQIQKLNPNVKFNDRAYIPLSNRPGNVNKLNPIPKGNGLLAGELRKGGSLYEHGGPHRPDGINQELLDRTLSNIGKDTINADASLSGASEVIYGNQGLQGVGDTLKGIGSSVGSFLKNNGNDLLRTIPIARNLLKKGPEAEVTSFNRLDDRFKPSRIDETNLLNRIRTTAGNTRRALTESSGGNLGDLRSSLLQSQINELRGISDASFAQSNFDARQNELGQNFNKDTNIRNQAISTQETIANEQNQAAARAQKQAMISAGIEDLGLLGKEGKQADILKNTLGYTPTGNKFDPQSGFLSRLLQSKKSKNQEAADFEEYLKQKYG